MANFFEETIKNYSGLSTETKPTIALGNNVPNGSRWREVDTSLVFFFNSSDDTWYLVGAAVDSATHAATTLSYEHHEIHGGSHYYLQGYLELNDTDTFYVKLVTPDTTKWSHFVYDIRSTGICTSYFDEGASGGMAGGASVVPINNNRNSANVSGMVFTSGVTVATTYTTRIESDMWGAAGFKENIGGSGGRGDELVLKQNTTYLRTFISGADSNIIQFKASWYEHVNKV